MFSFYDTNLINSESVSSFFEGTTFGYLTDKNAKTKWYPTGTLTSNTVLFTVALSDTTSNLTLMLKNHNLTKFYVYMVGYPHLSFTVAVIQNNSFSNTMITMPYANGIRYVQLGMYAYSGSVPFIGEAFLTKSTIAEFNAPSSENFSEAKRTVGTTRTMSDGGVVNIRTSNKYSADINLTYVPTSTYEDLLDVWNANKYFTFVPFPNPINVLTGTTAYASVEWNGQAELVQWIGDFSANFKSNNIYTGYVIPIKLREVPS